MPSLPPVAVAPKPKATTVAQVVVETRVGSASGLFDYRIPDALLGQVQVGQRVQVPFGKRSATGFVYALTESPGVVNPRPIAAIIDAEPLVPPYLLELAGWISRHYLAPLDEVVRAIVPPRVRAVSKRVSSGPRRASRILKRAAIRSAAQPGPVLEAAQQAAVDRIQVALQRQESRTFLLH
ncbi:MAG TPA: hypothetical protein VEQ12_08035, partial [Candidatus Limnocylindria bacterium]|nr:hypothetical protein [Candidatus Limnocylindria bacterium]